jgi:fatty acid-binding protein DegV
MREVDRCRGFDGAAEAMARFVRAGGSSLRVGVGVSDAGTVPLVEALEQRLRAAPEIREVVRYVIGPSVGAHTGPGTVGAMYAPVP